MLQLYKKALKCLVSKEKYYGNQNFTFIVTSLVGVVIHCATMSVFI